MIIFDLISLALCTKPLPSNHSEYLMEYFLCVFMEEKIIISEEREERLSSGYLYCTSFLLLLLTLFLPFCWVI